MSDALTQSPVFPEPPANGLSRREYWKLVAAQAHPAAAAAQEDLTLPEKPPFTQLAAPAENQPELPSQRPANEPPAPPTGNLAVQPAPEPQPAKPRRRLHWPRFHFGSPLWTIASLLSLTVNLVLLVALFLLAQQVFGIKNALKDELVGGLAKNFAMMDQARIKTTIPINTTVPAKFDLPLNTVTTVVLQKDVLLKNATLVSLKTGGLSITNAPAEISLPAGTELPVSLNIVVPVDQQIPVNLSVDVDIPLSQTDLHTPFVGLQKVVSPYQVMLDNTPNSLQEAVCGPEPSDLCKWMIP